MPKPNDFQFTKSDTFFELRPAPDAPPVVTIHADGHVEIGEGHTLDEASRAFWESVATIAARSDAPPMLDTTIRGRPGTLRRLFFELRFNIENSDLPEHIRARCLREIDLIMHRPLVAKAVVLEDSDPDGN